MTVSSRRLRAIGTPEQLKTRLGTLEFVDGVPTGEHNPDVVLCPESERKSHG